MPIPHVLLLVDRMNSNFETRIECESNLEDTS